MNILIKRHTDVELPKKTPVGDWIDLRAAERVTLKAGESALISLGVSMKLPEGYGAILAPRSSTFKRTGLLQANSIGVFENSFCGNDDVWGFFAYATRDITIEKNERICQFMIYPLQPEVEFTEVETLPDKSRDGWGSTGVS